VGAKQFCKMIELRRERVGREAGRGLVIGPRVRVGSLAGVRAGGSSIMGARGASRVGPRRARVSCAGGARGWLRGVLLAWSIGWTGGSRSWTPDLAP
jgi:hypothetical protein